MLVSTSKRRKFAALGAAGILAAGLAACSNGDSGGAGSDTAADRVQVRVITATPTTAGTWDPSQKKAYEAAAAAGDWDLSVAETVPYGNAEQVLDQWGAEGVDVVFSTDNGYEENILNAASKYPDTAWVVMSALSTTDGLDNVAAYNFDWCEYGYLQGAIAGVITETGKVGAVGPIEILPVTQTLASLTSAVDGINPAAEVVSSNTGSFNDVQKAQTVAAGLIGDGADVLVALVQGAVSPQIAAEAQQQGAYYVGSFGDETEAAPEATVSSVVIDFRQGYEQAVEGWVDGDFSAEIHTTGVSEGTISSTPLKLGFEDMQDEVDAVEEQLANNEISWPAGPCEQAS